MMIKWKISKKGLLMILLAILCLSISYAQNTTTTISGIRSEKGQIILNVFRDSGDYEQEKILKKLVFEKKQLIMES